MIVHLYAKSAVDLHGKTGAYAFSFYRDGEIHTEQHSFKSVISSLAQADCKAYVNTLGKFVGTIACMEGKVTELHIYTDSGVVNDLLSIAKSQRGCEEIAKHWRDKVQPKIPPTTRIIYQKISRDARTHHNHRLLVCAQAAQRELTELKMSFK